MPNVSGRHQRAADAGKVGPFVHWRGSEDRRYQRPGRLPGHPFTSVLEMAIHVRCPPGCSPNKASTSLLAMEPGSSRASSANS